MKGELNDKELQELEKWLREEGIDVEQLKEEGMVIEENLRRLDKRIHAAQSRAKTEHSRRDSVG